MKPSLTELIKKEHYRNIFRLLMAYEKTEKQKGLKQRHFRFALMKKPDLCQTGTITEMEKFFAGTLEHFYEKGIDFKKFYKFPKQHFEIMNAFETARLSDNLYIDTLILKSLNTIWYEQNKSNLKNFLQMKKGCITSKSNLNNFLTNLSEWGYVKKDKRTDRWYLTKYFFETYEREKDLALIIQNLKARPRNDLKIIIKDLNLIIEK